MKTPTRLFLTVGCLLWFATVLWSQPYIDPIQVRYLSGFNNSSSDVRSFTHFWAGGNLPIELRENTYLVLSPAYEQWQFDMADAEVGYPTLHGLSLPVGLITPFGESRWSLTLMPVVRTFGEELFGEQSFQVGAITLASYARTPTQKFSFGAYANAEFFGLFAIPLVGIDWRIDDRNYLSGVIPSNLTFEHRWTDHWYGGFLFRSPMNSFRLDNGEYLRLNDAQISLFSDHYLTDHLCLTLEAGYGLLRQLRTGVDGRNYLSEPAWGDGVFLRVSAAYRVRL
jgi:hypothetical protein